MAKPKTVHRRLGVMERADRPMMAAAKMEYPVRVPTWAQKEALVIGGFDGGADEDEDDKMEDIENRACFIRVRIYYADGIFKAAAALMAWTLLARQRRTPRITAKTRIARTTRGTITIPAVSAGVKSGIGFQGLMNL